MVYATTELPDFDRRAMACGNNDVSREELSSPPAPPSHPEPTSNPLAPERQSRFEQISQAIITATQVVGLVVDLVMQQLTPHPVTQQDLAEWYASMQEHQIEERMEQAELATAVALEEQSTPVAFESS